MTAEVKPARPDLRRRVVRWILERCAFAAIGVSFAATSISTFGADVATGASGPTTVRSQVMGTGHRAVTAPPSARPDGTRITRSECDIMAICKRQSALL
jgi:hypothetical protein